MNSKGWKVSLFALVAVIGLSACGEKKKQKPGSPFSGVWINQENLQDYSTHRAELNANDRRSFCRKVYARPDRYGDDQYRLRALLVQANGEVFRYQPGDSATALGFRERNLVGTVNTAGHFTAGTIGPDGRIASNWGAQQVDTGYDLPAQTNFNINPANPNVLRVFSNGKLIIYERHLKPVVDEYSIHVTSCLGKWREHQETRRPAPPKDFDPEVEQREQRDPRDQHDPRDLRDPRDARGTEQDLPPAPRRPRG